MNTNTDNSFPTIETDIGKYRSNLERLRYLTAIEERLHDANNGEVTFFNDRYLNALCLTHVMLQRTQRSLSIVTGHSVTSFLGILREPLTIALQNIKQQSRDLKNLVRILILKPLGDKDESCIQQEIANFDKTISVKFCETRPSVNIHHAIISDARDYRLEELHKEITTNSDATEIRARVVFNARDAFRIQNEFESLWSDSTKFFK